MKYPALKGGVLNPTANNTFAAVICAAGSSRRMNGIKKEYRTLPGSNLTVLAAAVSAFAAVPNIATIAIAVPNCAGIGESASFAAANDEAYAVAKNALPPGLLGKERPKIIFVAGGETRRASVHNALRELCAYSPGYVLIHDGARPWVSPALVKNVIDAVQQFNAVIPLLPLAETPKEIDTPFALQAENSGAGTNAAPVFVSRHLRRQFLGVAQTPQGFAFKKILSAHEKAAQRESAGYEYTDDAEVWGEFVGPVAVIPGSPENKKITFPSDLSPGI